MGPQGPSFPASTSRGAGVPRAPGTGQERWLGCGTRGVPAPWHPPCPSLVAGLGGLSTAWCSAPAPASGSSCSACPQPTSPWPPAPHPGRPAGRAGAPFLPPVLQALTRLQLLPLEPAHPHPPPPRPPQRPLQRPGQRWGQLPQVTWQLLFAPVSLRDRPCARGTRPPLPPQPHRSHPPRLASLGLADGDGHQAGHRGSLPWGCSLLGSLGSCCWLVSPGPPRPPPVPPPALPPTRCPPPACAAPRG